MMLGSFIRPGRRGYGSSSNIVVCSALGTALTVMPHDTDASGVTIIVIRDNEQTRLRQLHQEEDHACGCAGCINKVKKRGQLCQPCQRQRQRSRR